MWLDGYSLEEIAKKRKRPVSEVEVWITDWKESKIVR